MSTIKLILVFFLVGLSFIVAAQEQGGYFEFMDIDPHVEIEPMRPIFNFQTPSKETCDVLVKVAFVALGKGTLQSTEVIESHPPGDFDQAAIASLKAHVPLFDKRNPDARIKGVFVYYGENGCPFAEPTPRAENAHNKSFNRTQESWAARFRGNVGGCAG